MNKLNLTFVSFLSIALIIFAGLFVPVSAVAQQAGQSLEVTGEASVVIFDNFETGHSEIRYYIVDQKSQSEKQLFFQDGPPSLFKTGKKVVVRGQGRANGIDVESVVTVDGEPDSAQSSAETEAAPATPETRNVLTLLVDFNDALVAAPGGGYGTNVQDVKDRMYNQSKSVAGLFFNTSLGNLTLDPDADSNGQQDVFHVSINDSYIGGDSNQCNSSSWVSQASAAWEAANPTKNISIYRHRLLIVPNYWDYGNRHCTWGGVAQVGCGGWCWSIGADPDTIMHGVIIHELGHNLGFNHARTDQNNNGYDPSESTDSGYGDTSDMMGSSRSWMKFNAPHAEDKGWINPTEFEIRGVVATDSPQVFDLLAMDEEVWDWPGLRALKLERSSNTDYYVSYRLTEGDYNNVNSAYRNRVNIHYGFDNSTYTYFITALSPGQSFTDPAQDLVITAGSEAGISANGLNTTVISVEVCQQACGSLAAPTALVATAQSTDTMDLGWNDNSATEDGFDIQRSLDGSGFSALTTVGADVTAYTDTGLGTATDYFYRVRATEAGNPSGWSNTASDSTLAIPPLADFTFVRNFLAVNFTDASNDSDGTIVGWNWAFGDGNVSSSQNPSHLYAAEGTFQVSLTVTDDDGATANDTQGVTVFAAPNVPPVAGFSSNINGLTVNFSDTSSDSDGTIASWSWDFGDSSGSSSQSPAHSYAAGGTYTVSLTVLDDDGASNMTSQQVTVVEPPNVPPVADFTFNATDLSVSFTDTSSDSDGSIASWSWDFGDTGGSSAQNPNHTYAATGSYDVSLTVTDNDGDSNLVSKSVSVTAPPSSQDYPAVSETAVAGSVSGSYLATEADDGSYQSIRERESGGKKSNRYSFLEHLWNFTIPSGNSASISVNAWQTASSDGDNFDFAWSSNGGPWIDMFMVSATSDGTPLSFELPASTSGSVSVRVMDSDRLATHRSLDTVFVDSILITVSNAAAEPLEGDAPDNLVATATSYSTVDLSWDDLTSNEAGFRVERSEDGFNFISAGTTGPNGDGSALYMDTGLSGSVSYTYRVYAFKGLENSENSNPAVATTDPEPTISIETDGYKVKGRQRVDVTWSGVSTGTADIYRDSLKINTDNDDFHTDIIGNKGGGSYAYKVCDAGSTSACSPVDIVVF